MITAHQHGDRLSSTSVDVSVIVPCYNAERWIREALTSALSQAGVSVEVIVVDDGSTDASARIVAADFPTVRLIATPNGGPSRARNIGTQTAQGAFIQYLDADDWLPEGKLAAQTAALHETGADIAYGDWQHVFERAEGAKQSGPVIVRTLSSDAEAALFTGDFWCPIHSYLYRRSIIAQTKGFNEGLPVIQDARFTLDCALHGARFVRVPGHITQYRMHSTEQNSRRSQLRFTRDVLTNATEIDGLWSADGPLSTVRRAALIKGYEFVARSSFASDKAMFEAAYSRLEQLSPRYVPSSPRTLALLTRLVGYRRAEALALRYRQGKAMLRATVARLARAPQPTRL